MIHTESLFSPCSAPALRHCPCGVSRPAGGTCLGPGQSIHPRPTGASDPRPSDGVLLHLLRQRPTLQPPA